MSLARCKPNKVFLSVDEVEEVAKWNPKGWEIKNAFKTAVKWCINKEERVTVDKVLHGIQVTVPQAEEMVIHSAIYGDLTESHVGFEGGRPFIHK